MQTRQFVTIAELSTESTVHFHNMEGYLSKKSIHINESFVFAIALALW